MNTNYNIDDHLQNSMDNFEIQPRITSFDAVMQKLEKKRRRRFFILFFFGAFVSLLGSLIILNIPPGKALAGNFKNRAVIKNAPVSKKKLADKEKVLKKQTTRKQLAQYQKNSGIKKEKIIIPEKIQKESARKNTHLPVTTATRLKSAITIQSVHGVNSQAQPDINDSLASDSTNFKETPFVFLDQKYLALKNSDSVSLELITSTAITLPVESTQKSDTSAKNKKRFKFMVGLNANPQLSSYQFSENKQRDAVYDNNTGATFSKLYLENRKKQNSFKLNYAFGIKFGLNVDDKWELWLAAGIQRYTYSERLYALALALSNNLVGPSGINFNAAPPSSYYENGFKSSFTYVSYGLDFNRIIKPNPFLKLKFGLGLKANNLLMANYIYVKSPDVYYSNNYTGRDYLSLWMYTTNLNLGVIKDLSKRLQFRLSPGVFYSPSSMFNKNYVIKQKSYGLEVECLLVLKLF